MKRATMILALVGAVAGGGYGAHKAIKHYRKTPATAETAPESPDASTSTDADGADAATWGAPADSANSDSAYAARQARAAAASAPTSNDQDSTTTASEDAPSTDPFTAARSRYSRPRVEATVRGQSEETADAPSDDSTANAEEYSTPRPRFNDSRVSQAGFSTDVDAEAAEADASGAGDEVADAASARESAGPRGGRRDYRASGETEPRGRRAAEGASRRPRVLEPADAEPIEEASDAGASSGRTTKRGGAEADRGTGDRRTSDRKMGGRAATTADHRSGSESRSSRNLGADGAGRPGGRMLEGPQTSALTVQKLAPAEVQVGIEAIFEIKLRNAGQVVAHDVVVHDSLPEGTKLVSTEPEAEQGGGDLSWRLESVAPGEERTFRVTLIPTAEGELGSVARVSYAADSSVRTLSTRPQLAVEVASPGEVLIGQAIPLRIRVTNPGTGVATGVLIEASLPDGMRHDSGRVIESDLGDLAPGESRDLELSVIAAKPGSTTAVLTARGDGDLEASEPAKVNILAPELKLTLEGAKRRFLEREATYVITIANPGTAAAKNVDLAVQLPPGINYVKSDNYGEYDARSRTIRWSLTELPAGESGQVTWSALPTATGAQTLLIDGAAELGLKAHQEQTIQVDGVAAIKFEVVDVDDPVEVGGETTYEIRVVNQGSKAARRIEVVVLAPEGLRIVDADGPVKHQVEPQRALFDPLSELAPKADTVYRVRVVGERAGDHRMRVELTSDELTEPVTKQESTRVLPAE